LADQVTDGAARLSSELAAGVVPATADQLPLARFYMTSDLRAATGLPRTHLDYYLREGLILPTARTESGYLLFDDNELETLRSIIAQRQAGVAIREIRRRLGR
jgi:MerR family Zn(II)-responsive transcriptional regulator of zntA